MPPINTKFQTPSSYSDHDKQGNLFSFLGIGNFKHLYNKMLRTCEKYAKKSATVWFLTQCIEGEIVPRTFRISNRSQSQDANTNSNWNAATLNASIEMMKIALEKEKVEETKLFEETDHQLQVLIILARECDKESAIDEINILVM